MQAVCLGGGPGSPARKQAVRGGQGRSQARGAGEHSPDWPAEALPVQELRKPTRSQDCPLGDKDTGLFTHQLEFLFEGLSGAFTLLSF